MRIGVFAQRACVSPSKVRFYEARGLLPAPSRGANGYRAYGEADLRIVSFVDRARSLGFTLADIARFMARSAEQRRTKAGVTTAFKAKLAEADRHIAELSACRKLIQQLLSELRSQDPD